MNSSLFPLRAVELSNPSGRCWTCVKKDLPCDGGLPAMCYLGCRLCNRRGVRCRGYHLRLHWSDEIMGRTSGVAQRCNSKRLRSLRRQSTQILEKTHSGNSPRIFSPLTLPAEDSFFMNHFIHNVARIALAIDYTGNGYRCLLPMALQEPALLNAVLAVAASHYSRWCGSPDSVSRRYLESAAKALQDRFTDSKLVGSPVTLATMLLLVSYEVFSGSSGWKCHYDAIRGWVRAQYDCTNLDPFLKTWICLIETQCAMNLGLPVLPELESWLNVETDACEPDTIDVLLGCSAKLPRLMCAASRLYAQPNSSIATSQNSSQQAAYLQDQIRATAISLQSQPHFGITCSPYSAPLTEATGMGQKNLQVKSVAVAEIFRHASHIYVYRNSHNPQTPLTFEIQESLETAKHLLTLVPDALGPGANLGWCLVVLGAEMGLEHEREYIRSRLGRLQLLGFHNTKSSQDILEEVWSHADLVNKGQAIPEKWQDAMQRIGQSQILV